MKKVRFNYNLLNTKEALEKEANHVLKYGKHSAAFIKLNKKNQDTKNKVKMASIKYGATTNELRVLIADALDYDLKKLCSGPNTFSYDYLYNNEVVDVFGSKTAVINHGEFILIADRMAKKLQKSVNI